MRSSVITAIVLAVGSGALAASPEVAAKVRAGNAAYQAGEYAKALEVYDAAEVQCPECPEVAYNRGLAYYRLRDFVKARENFNTALATRDLGLEARAKYNLGNVAYAQALEKLNAPKEAVESARQAMFHYRDALELNPDDSDARANIEIAQLFIKDMLDKLKKQQEEQQKKQDQQQQGQPDQDQQQQPQDQQSGDEQQNDEQNQEQQQNEQGEQQSEEKDQEPDGEKQQQQDADQQQNQDPQDNQQQEAQQASDQQNDEQQEAQAAVADEKKMSAEEVERALQAVRDREAERRAERARRKNLRRAPVTRDW